METSVELVNPQEFGIEEKTATELTKGLKQILSERDLLQSEFETVSKLEVDENSIPTFKNLRLRIRDNRTKGINEWHKAGKEYFLRGGQFLDAIKRKEIQVNENMERALEEGEKYFENLEKQRKEKLRAERWEKLSKYMDVEPQGLGQMDEAVYNHFLNGAKSAHEEKIAAEKKAEAERLEREKSQQIHRDRKEKILPYWDFVPELIGVDKVRRNEFDFSKLTDAEWEERFNYSVSEKQKHEAEQEKQRKENERLKIEAEKREKAIADERKKQAEKEAKERAEREKERAAMEAKLKAEADARKKLEREEAAKRQALEKELQDKKDAEIKAVADAEAAKQAELNKGDADKVKDLIADLESLKTKYTFKSAKNSKMYADVSTLIDKIINHINK